MKFRIFFNIKAINRHGRTAKLSDAKKQDIMMMMWEIPEKGDGWEGSEIYLFTLHKKNI